MTCLSADRAPSGSTLPGVSPERRWWHNVLRVLTRPGDVFEQLRERSSEDRDARQEPALLIVLVAGTAGVLMTPVAGGLLDEPEYDALLIAVWAFIGGIFYGAAIYLLGGVALWLAARGMGSTDDWRLARHILAFSAVPVAASLVVVLPIRLLAFGGDIFRSGGADGGAAGALLSGARLLFVAWSVGLLLVGLRTVYRFSWPRAAGALALVVLFGAAIAAIPSVL